MGFGPIWKALFFKKGAFFFLAVIEFPEFVFSYGEWLKFDII